MIEVFIEGDLNRSKEGKIQRETIEQRNSAISVRHSNRIWLKSQSLCFVQGA